MPIDKAEKLAKVLELLKQDTITPKELENFLTMVIGVIKKTNENFVNLSAEKIQQIEKIISDISEEHAKVMAEVGSKNKDCELLLKNYLEEAKSFLEAVKAIKQTPGNDGYTPVKGVDYFDGKDGENGKDGSPDTAEQLRDKLETLEGEERLDAKAIKNLPKYVDKTIIAHQHNIAWFDEQTLVINNPTQVKFAGAGVQVTQEAVTGALLVTISGGAGANESNNETLTNTGDNTNFTFANTPQAGGVRNVWIAQTGQLLTTTTDYTVSGATLTLTTPNAGVTLIANYTYA